MRLTHQKVTVVLHAIQRRYICPVMIVNIFILANWFSSNCGTDAWFDVKPHKTVHTDETSVETMNLRTFFIVNKGHLALIGLVTPHPFVG